MTRKGTLYLIPNTLGEESDGHALFGILPETVARITASLDYFIVENAKSARAHLKRIDRIHPLVQPLQQIRMAELNVRTDKSRLPELLEPLLSGQDGGLISEAGVPAVADPGADLVRLAHEKGITVRPLVGPSSLLLALMASGLNGQSFAFNGYLPTDAEQRQRRIRSLEERSRHDRQTQIFIETPYRNDTLLKALCTTCKPDTRLCVATDLTLPAESIQTLSVAAWKKRIEKGQMPDFQKKPTVFLLLANLPG